MFRVMPLLNQLLQNVHVLVFTDHKRCYPKPPDTGVRLAHASQKVVHVIVVSNVFWVIYYPRSLPERDPKGPFFCYQIMTCYGEVHVCITVRNYSLMIIVVSSIIAMETDRGSRKCVWFRTVLWLCYKLLPVLLTANVIGFLKLSSGVPPCVLMVGQVSCLQSRGVSAAILSCNSGVTKKYLANEGDIKTSLFRLVSLLCLPHCNCYRCSSIECHQVSEHD